MPNTLRSGLDLISFALFVPDLDHREKLLSLQISSHVLLLPLPLLPLQSLLGGSAPEDPGESGQDGGTEVRVRENVRGHVGDLVVEEVRVRGMN